MANTRIIFNEDTDYDAVLVATKLLFSDAVSENCGCGCGCTDNKLCKALVYITAADINKASLDQVRYEEAVEAAYLTLDCNC